MSPLVTGAGRSGLITYKKSKELITDPYFNNVSLLLHMEGANNSTTFTDSSKNNAPITAYGDAKISTSQSKFGSSSATFDGNGDYLVATLASGFDFGTGDFTIECFLNLNTLSAGYQNIIDFRGGSDSTSPVISVYNAQLQYFVTPFSRITYDSLSQTNTWYHIAVARNSGNTRMFLDGTQVGSTYSDSNNYINTGSVNIGRWPPGNSSWLNGFVDEVRITKGICRYVNNFTAPSSPFPNS